MKIKNQNTILLVSAMLIALTSCKSKKESDTLPLPKQENTVKGVVSMHLHNYLDIAEVDDYNIVYTTLNERQVTLEVAQLYMSHFEFLRQDGSSYTIPDSRILKTQNVYTYSLGEIPVGEYKTFRFRVGLDSITNNQNPETSSDKILNNRSMWFNSTPQPDNFIFVNVKGKIDTTSDASADPSRLSNFDYKLTSNRSFKLVTMPVSKIVITEGQVEYLHMKIDWSKIFNGIRLSDPANLSIVTKEDSNSDLASKLVKNLPSMFIYE